MEEVKLHVFPVSRPSPRFTMSALRVAFEVHSVHWVSSLVKAAGCWINLNCRVLDTKDCAALHFTLHNCDSVKLSLLWSSLPAEGLESIVSLLHRISQLRYVMPSVCPWWLYYRGGG